jgi:hypothetical protein
LSTQSNLKIKTQNYIFLLKKNKIPHKPGPSEELLCLNVLGRVVIA